MVVNLFFKDLAASTKELLSLFLALAENRLELLALELREEQIRLIRLCVWVAVAVATGLLTLILATIAVVFLVDAAHRPAALIGFTLFYLLLALVSVATVLRKLKNYSLPFSQTIAEFKKDRDAL